MTTYYPVYIQLYQQPCVVIGGWAGQAWPLVAGIAFLQFAVSDALIIEAQKELGKAESIFTAPEGTTTLAALKELVKTKVDPSG